MWRRSSLVLPTDQRITKTEQRKSNIEQLHHEYQLAFANGGDQYNNSIREVAVCEVLKIELFDGLGYKIQSSSWLLN